LKRLKTKKYEKPADDLSVLVFFARRLPSYDWQNRRAGGIIEVLLSILGLDKFARFPHIFVRSSKV
jgi:hypothetical protein